MEINWNKVLIYIQIFGKKMNIPFHVPFQIAFNLGVIKIGYTISLHDKNKIITSLVGIDLISAYIGNYNIRSFSDYIIINNCTPSVKIVIMNGKEIINLSNSCSEKMISLNPYHTDWKKNTACVLCVPGLKNLKNFGLDYDSHISVGFPSNIAKDFAYKYSLSWLYSHGGSGNYWLESFIEDFLYEGGTDDDY